MIVESFPDRKITIEGEEYLYFGGTSYLGMATYDKFQKLLIDNLLKWGTSYGSSRNSNVKLSIYKKFENQFSTYVNAEDTLAISSGMLAGKFIIQYLSRTIESFYHLSKTHPAILSENSLPLIINGKLNPTLRNDIEEEIVITADAILSLEVLPTSFDFLNQISSKKKITLVIDESHSLGIIGINGNGVFDSVNNSLVHRKILVSSLGKALGLAVGVISSDKQFVDLLKSEPTYTSASATNPAYLATFTQAQEIYKLRRSQLKSNLDFLFENLKPNKGYLFNRNYPVIHSSNELMFNILLKNKIVITRFKYPTYKGFLNRIVITANHTKNDLKKLINVLNYNYEK